MEISRAPMKALSFCTPLVAAGLILSLQVSCKRLSRVNPSGFVLGASDDIARYDEDQAERPATEAAKSSVLVVTKLGSDRRKFCSGSIINVAKQGQEEALRILTNFHCFARTDEAGTVQNEFLPEACRETSIYFDFNTDNAASAEPGTCKNGTLAGDFAGDLASFEFNAPSGQKFKAVGFWPTEDIPSDRPALIIHYPDVKSNYRRVGKDGLRLPAASVTDNDCFTKGGFSVQEWPLDHALPFSFKHTCDLIHGSSGSGLIDRQTGALLGVNWGGIEISYKKSSEKFNAATSINYVRAFLSGETQILKDRADQQISEEQDEEKRKNKNSPEAAAGEMKKALCGTVGASFGSEFCLPLVVVLLLPLFFALVQSARRKFTIS